MENTQTWSSDLKENAQIWSSDLKENAQILVFRFKGKCAIFRGGLKKSRFVAENGKFRDLSRKT